MAPAQTSILHRPSLPQDERIPPIEEPEAPAPAPRPEEDPDLGEDPPHPEKVPLVEPTLPPPAEFKDPAQAA